jgi:hypothetical protein
VAVAPDGQQVLAVAGRAEAERICGAGVMDADAIAGTATAVARASAATTSRR